MPGLSPFTLATFSNLARVMSMPAPIHPSHHPSPSPHEYTNSPPITIILTLVLLLFFFVGFFSIYFCRCFMQNLIYTWHLRYSFAGSQIGGPAVSKPGLDPLIVQSYPTFSYSNVKEYTREKYGLECAICLVEFVDSDILRLLTPCSHVFHQKCIDLWLESHKTCPVCRRDLASKVESDVKCRLDSESEVHEIEIVDRDSFRITIKEDDEDTSRGSERACEEGDEHVTSKVCKFSRSHSTGHSIVRNGEQAKDRFTLILPDHVKPEIINKGHNASRSWTTYGEYKNRLYKGKGCLVEASELSSGNITKV